MQSKVIGLDRAHLWLAEPTRIRDERKVREYEAWLTREERDRANSFVFPKHRHEYLVTRALERTALSSYAGKPPGSLRFARDARGRPTLSPGLGLSYNLSNTLELVVCLVADSHEVGVDTEPLSHAGQILEVAGSVFAPEEHADLARLPAADVRRRVVELWTLKESYIKALGKGMELPLDQFWFDLRGERPRLVVSPRIADDASRWSFALVELDEQLVAMCIGCGSATTPSVERFAGLVE